MVKLNLILNKLFKESGEFKDRAVRSLTDEEKQLLLSLAPQTSSIAEAVFGLKIL